jgi:hypothetical protein
VPRPGTDTGGIRSASPNRWGPRLDSRAGRLTVALFLAFGLLAAAPGAGVAVSPVHVAPPSPKGAVAVARGTAPADQPSSSTYYVAAGGSDAAAGDSAHPFLHIQRCADVANPGDTCVVRPGTYRETVKPARSGAAGAPITYRAETPGTVRVDGSDPVSAWTPVATTDVATLATTDPFLLSSPFANAVSAGRVYKAHVAVDPSVAEPELYVGDQAMSDAAFPDPAPDPLEPAVELAGAGTGSTGSNIVDPVLTQPPGYWAGAHAYVQTTSSALTAVVGTSAPGTISMSGWYGAPADQNRICTPVLAGHTRYFLYGKLSELNAPREWFYDRASQTLYFSPPNGTLPDPGAVSVKQRMYGFDLNGISDTTVNGMNLFGTTIRTGDASQRDVLSGLSARYPSHFMDFVPDPDPTVGYGRGCDSQFAGLTTTGIILRGSNNIVRDSTISNSAGNGVVLLGDHNTVTNNVIHDVDSSGGRPAGVFLFGHDQTIANNSIYSTGRGAIEATFQNWQYAMPNNRITYNDLSRYGRLSQDFGGIYICCQIDFAGSSIDHNWVHDPQDMANVPASADIGIYVDGGASNQLIASNVGWGNNHLTVGLVANGGTNNRIYNNDGGVWVSDFNPAPGTDIANNIGEVVVTGSDPSIAVPASNLQPPADPGYVDQAARDFRLTSGSKARQIAKVAPGGTDGATDTPPDAGAYQYGTPYWQPGASTARAVVIRPQYGASTAVGTPTWWWVQPDGAQGRNDSHPDYYAVAGPYNAALDATLKLTYQSPTGAGLAIDHVEVRLYARLHRQYPGTDANVVVSADGTPVYDAGHTDFDATGRPITIDLTAAVGGDWSKLPKEIDLHATTGVAPYNPSPTAWDTTQIDVHAAEIVIEAHRV